METQVARDRRADLPSGEASSDGIIISPLTDVIGADVRGVDLSRPLGDAAVRTLRRALLDHLVLFFREQPILSPEQHMAAGRAFGELEPMSFSRAGGNTFVGVIDQTSPKGSESSHFHADNTFRPRPPLGALLQAHILPSQGGGTWFASMYAAYGALPADVQARLEGLEAYHSLPFMVRKLAGTGIDLAVNLDDWPPLKHPVVAVHPETGRKLLNVNYNWTTHVDGMAGDESRALLDFLFEHVARPEFQVRLKWNVGDVAFWDNRACQHYAVPDFDERRLMQRVLVEQPQTYPPPS